MVCDWLYRIKRSLPIDCRFQNAVNNKDKLSLSTPYLDALGSGFLVDAVHTVQEKSHDGERTEHNDVIAVLDAAFGMFQFYRQVAIYEYFHLL